MYTPLKEANYLYLMITRTASIIKVSVIKMQRIYTVELTTLLGRFSLSGIMLILS